MDRSGRTLAQQGASEADLNSVLDFLSSRPAGGAAGDDGAGDASDGRELARLQPLNC